MVRKIDDEVKDMRTEDEKLIEKNKEILEEKDETRPPINMNEKVPENVYEQESKWFKFFKTILQLIIFGLIALGMIYLQNIRTPENQTLTTWITLSILLNIMIIFISLLTGTGTEIVKRFTNKFRYKSGKFVNAILLMKSGVIKEVFTKKDELTGSIRMNGKPYVTNAKLMFNYKGIPSYFYREDNPDPLNIWQEGYARELSCSEMDTVMASGDSINAMEWLKNHVNYAVIGLALIIAIASFGAKMSYDNNKAFMETGDYMPSKTGVVCKMIVPVAQTENTQLTKVNGQVDTTNSTLQNTDLR